MDDILKLLEGSESSKLRDFAEKVPTKGKPTQILDFAEKVPFGITKKRMQIREFATKQSAPQRAINFGENVKETSKQIPIVSVESSGKKLSGYKLAVYLAGTFNFASIKGELFYAEKGSNYYRQLSLKAKSDAENFSVLVYWAIDEERHEQIRSSCIKEAYEILSVNRRLCPSVDAYNPEEYICLKNGVYEIFSGRLLHSISDQAFTVKLNAAYVDNPVLSEDIENYLSNLANGNENLPAFLSAFGYAISNNFSQQKAIFIVGPPRNGKSTWLKFLTSIFPKNYITGLSSKDLGNAFAPANLDNARLSISRDEPAVPWSPEAVSNFKLAVSSDEFLGQKKFVQQAIVMPKCHFVFAGNSAPMFKIKNDTLEEKGAILRRIIYLQAGESVPEEEVDVELEAKLERQKNDIVSVLLQYLTNFFRGEIQWPKPPGNLFYGEDKLSIENLLKKFMADGLWETTVPSDILKISEVCNKFNSFAGLSPAQALAPNSFSRKLAEIVGQNKIRKNAKYNASCLHGYKWKEVKTNEKTMDD